VTKQVKKNYQAYICALGLILCQCPNGWEPLDLGVRAWLCHPKNLEKRRLDPRSGTDSSWTMKRLSSEPYVVLNEMFEMIIKTAQMVIRVAGASPHSLKQVILEWLESDEALETTHPVTRVFLRESPASEIQCLSAICSIAIQDAEVAIEKLNIIRSLRKFNAFQVWAFIAKVFKQASDNEVSWLVPMEDQCILAEIRATRPYEQNKIAMLTNIVDKDEILRDSRLMNAADSKEGYSDIARIMGSELSRHMAQLQQGQQQSRDWQQRPARNPPNNGRNSGKGQGRRQSTSTDNPAAMRRAMRAHIREHNPNIARSREYEICAVFAMGRQCRASKDGGNSCSSKRFSRETKKKEDFVYLHKCLCENNAKHSIISCNKWHAR
jgi:hypothetical protein